MRKFLTAIAISCAAIPAYAGNLVVPADPVVAPAAVDAGRDWSGFFIGGTLGYTAYDKVSELDGMSYGVQAGYLHDFGKLVLGGVLSYDKISGDVADSELWAISARIGYDAGRFLPYFQAGYGQSTPDGFDGTDVAVLGAGVDYALSDNILLGLKYQYVLGDPATPSYNPPPPIPNKSIAPKEGPEPDNGTIAMTLSFKF